MHKGTGDMKHWHRSGGAIVRSGLVIVVVAACAYLFGLYSYPRGLWPVSLLRDVKNTTLSIGVYDEYGRLVAYPGKAEVPCPLQAAGTAVILAIGQSNVANHAAERITTRHPGAAINYFGGKCHAAASPLLGATQDGGEFLTLLADDLIDSGLYRNVVIVSSGIGGTAISRWRRHGYLNEMLLKTFKTLPPGYKVTEVIWHQGESDFMEATSTSDYVASFESLVDTLVENGVDAPIYISVSTRCGTPWTADNPTAAAQRAVVDNKRILLGADTDTLLLPEDRHDGCHYSETGQKKTAASYAEAIKLSRQAR
jgi:hypothetical protein